MLKLQTYNFLMNNNNSTKLINEYFQIYTIKDRPTAHSEDEMEMSGQLHRNSSELGYVCIRFKGG